MSILLDESRRLLDHSVKILDDLDSKAIEALKFAGVLVALTASAAGILRGAVARTPRLASALLLLGVFATLGAALLALASYSIQEVSIGMDAPRPGDASGLPQGRIASFVVEAHDEAVGSNRRTAVSKSLFLQGSLFFLGLAVLALASAGAALIARMMD